MLTVQQRLKIAFPRLPYLLESAARLVSFLFINPPAELHTVHLDLKCTKNSNKSILHDFFNKYESSHFNFDDTVPGREVGHQSLNRVAE